MTENKSTGDFIKLRRQDYEIILQWADELNRVITEEDDCAIGLSKRELEVRDKIQQILVNIQKFNANKRRQEVSR